MHADINWGSSSQAHVYRKALSQTQELNRVSDHVKNYRYNTLTIHCMRTVTSYPLSAGDIVSC